MFTLADRHYEYHVALSFAGEQRDYVESVCNYLEHGYGFKVFYDRNQESKLIGGVLTPKLKEVYNDHALFCAIFVSSAYLMKSWTKLELATILSRYENGDGESVLLFRFDDAEIPDISPEIGYIKIDNSTLRTAERIAALIAEKIRVRWPSPVSVVVGKSEISRGTDEDFVGVYFQCHLTDSDLGFRASFDLEV